MKKMGKKSLFCGVLATALLVSGMAYAAPAIKLMVDGKEVKSDAQAQIINGRVFVPARALAESLGGEVQWDQKDKIVKVKSNASQQNGAITSKDAYVIEDQKALISLPSEWKDKIKVEKKTNEVTFQYVPKNKAVKPEFFFSVLIINKTVWDKDEYADTGLFTVLGMQDGKVYALQTPSEAPYLEKPESPEFKESVDMLNHLRQSIQFMFIK
ncbi:copper amine oxidase N-terminal domain-containing protein [Brevibacillus laterosporus]|uniref:Copper amine oxidase N-terminal domain-containing protein n=1 Tax=Brevibacillus laterosporus TaxID=1465 RepID=A0AAP3GDD6_BRELA|nr:copper amine oxidase N-terminal domain-containing protein [Brevibacillus laterosporus]MBG9796817.1 copper amine oxidase [Brevibacillus laterosporus]MCR8939876.1 copper amine oxidase N-terminal domain-containing protein [Brevibacillus laterosporus]MCR8983009.1 copper amine oxidase N-terminal domain-containing protein [Brevibacillus laterosporus]MCZ0810165.1 copper amine oxidase N-terminal domain-containing protein [Brevibacillus laterosporus]MCZ0828791.1 copper amine oxidase N-terminal domai